MKITKEILEETIRTRRDFHTYPESGWTEYRTTAILVEKLEALGFSLSYGPEIHHDGYRFGLPDEKEDRDAWERALREGANPEILEKIKGGHTGVIARIKGDKQGPTKLFRFDIDCNEVEESKDVNHRPFKEGFSSVHPGRMHACGHDGHAAIGLSFAKLIKENQPALHGEIVLLFQAAEEGSRGARSYLHSHALGHIDIAIASHIGLSLNAVGEVALNVTKFQAGTKADVLFTGKSAHAGFAPQEANNALLAAANAVVNLYGISRHSKGESRVNVGSFESPGARNVVPAHALIKMESRGSDQIVDRYIFERMVQICQASATMQNCQVEIRPMGSSIGFESDPEFIDHLASILRNGPDRLTRDVVFGACEDFTFIMNEVTQQGGQATYLLFGTPLADGHHGVSFDFDEGVFEVALRNLTTLALNLNEG